MVLIRQRTYIDQTTTVVIVFTLSLLLNVISWAMYDISNTYNTEPPPLRVDRNECEKKKREHQMAPRSLASYPSFFHFSKVSY